MHVTCDIYCRVIALPPADRRTASRQSRRSIPTLWPKNDWPPRRPDGRLRDDTVGDPGPIRCAIAACGPGAAPVQSSSLRRDWTPTTSRASSRPRPGVERCTTSRALRRGSSRAGQVEPGDPLAARGVLRDLLDGTKQHTMVAWSSRYADTPRPRPAARSTTRVCEPAQPAKARTPPERPNTGPQARSRHPLFATHPWSVQQIASLLD
jgi:hypothetical protein